MIQPVGIPSTWKFHTNSYAANRNNILTCCAHFAAPLLWRRTQPDFQMEYWDRARGALLILRSLAHFGLFFSSFLCLSVYLCLSVCMCMVWSFTYLFVVITSMMWNIHHHFSSQNDDHIRTTAFTSIYARCSHQFGLFVVLTAVAAAAAVAMNTEMKDELNIHNLHEEEKQTTKQTMN